MIQWSLEEAQVLVQRSQYIETVVQRRETRKAKQTRVVMWRSCAASPRQAAIYTRRPHAGAVYILLSRVLSWMNKLLMRGDGGRGMRCERMRTMREDENDARMRVDGEGD